MKSRFHALPFPIDRPVRSQVFFAAFVVLALTLAATAMGQCGGKPFAPPCEVINLFLNVTVCPACGQQITPTSIWVEHENEFFVTYHSTYEGGNLGQGVEFNVATTAEGISPPLPLGAGAGSIALDAGGDTAYITNLFDSTLSVVNLDSFSVEQIVNLTKDPNSSQYSFDLPSGAIRWGNQVFVTSRGNYGYLPVYTVGSAANPDLTLQGALQTIPHEMGIPGAFSTGPTQSTLPNANDILVPAFDTSNGGASGFPRLYAVNPVTMTVVAKLSLPSSGAFPYQVVVNPNGLEAYVPLDDSSGGTGGVWCVNLLTFQTDTIIQTGDPANHGEAISADGRALLVAGSQANQIAIIDTVGKQLDTTIQTGNYPTSVAISKDGSQAFFTNAADGTVGGVSFSASI